MNLTTRSVLYDKLAYLAARVDHALAQGDLAAANVWATQWHRVNNLLN